MGDTETKHGIYKMNRFQRSKIIYFDLLFAIVLLGYQLYVNRGRLLGNDYNWDLLNYHLINVTLKQDLALHASNIQSFFPSTLDRLISPIHTSIPSPFSGLIMLTPFVFNFIIIKKLFIQRLLEESFRLPNTLTVISLSSSVAISQMNNSMGDLVLSPLVLAGIAMFLIGVKESDSKILVLSAIPLGVALSLKWTYLYVQISLFLLLIVLIAVRAIKISSLIKWGFINAGIFLLFSLHQFTKLYIGTRNPVFPFANGLFKSESYPEINFRDNRFGLRTILDYFETPLKLARGQEGGTSELLFQDIRLLILVLSLVLWVIYSMHTLISQKFKEVDVLTNLVFFTFFAYVSWGYLFGISRYFLAIDLLIPLIALSILAKISRLLVNNSLVNVSLILGLAMLLNGNTTSVNWGYDPSRTSHIAFEKAIYPIKVASKSALLLADMPLGFMSYQIRSKSDIVYLSPAFNEYNLQDQLQLIDKRVIYSLSYNNNIDFLNEVLFKYGVQGTPKCQTIKLNFNNGLTPSTVFLCETKSP